MPFPPKLQEEFLDWLEIEGKKNDRLQKIMRKYEKEAALQFYMYRMGYSNRAYAMEQLKGLGGE